MPKRARVVANEKGRELYRNNRGFVEAKQAIDETAERVLPHGYMSAHPTFRSNERMTQAPLGGGNPNAMTLDDVYEAAKAAEPPFQRTMRGIAKGAGLDPDERVLFEDEPLPIDRHHTPIQYFKRLLFAPAKGRARSHAPAMPAHAPATSLLCRV